MKNYDLSAEATVGMLVLQNAERRMHMQNAERLSFVIRVRKLSE